MPFTVESATTLTSDIKRHFTQSIQRQDQQCHASFRGRPLNGEDVRIPDGYVGIVAHAGQPLSTFDQLTYFNLDCATSKNDCLARSIQWLSIAKTLHDD